jgi:hypothetical protein
VNLQNDNYVCAGISAPPCVGPSRPRTVDTLDSLAIVPPDTPDGAYVIRAVFLGRDGELTVDLRASDVLTYAACRRWVLARTGVFYRAEIYEGRGGGEMWEETVEHLMGQEVAR